MKKCHCMCHDFQAEPYFSNRSDAECRHCTNPEPVKEPYNLELAQYIRRQTINEVLEKIEEHKCEVPEKPSWEEASKSLETMEQLFAHIGRTNYNKALSDLEKALEEKKG